MVAASDRLSAEELPALPRITHGALKRAEIGRD